MFQAIAERKITSEISTSGLNALTVLYTVIISAAWGICVSKDEKGKAINSNL